jgi:uncharacterized lipoprotein YajG
MKKVLVSLATLLALAACAAPEKQETLEGRAELRGPVQSASLFLIEDSGTTWVLTCKDRAELQRLDGRRLVVKGAPRPGLSVTAPGVPLFCAQDIQPR